MWNTAFCGKISKISKELRLQIGTTNATENNEPFSIMQDNVCTFFLCVRVRVRVRVCGCLCVGGLVCLCGCMCQRSLVQETNYLRLMHKNEKLVFLFHLFPRVPGDIKNNTGRKGVTWRLTSENGNEAEKQVSGKNIGSGSLCQRPAFVTKTI